jgi:hypothetical protein
MAEANSLVEHLKSQTVVYQGAETQVSEILKDDSSGQLLPVFLALADDGEARKSMNRKIAGSIPPIDGFVNREEELEKLNEMLEDELSKVMVIYGSQGYGTSTLAAKFLDLNNRKWSAAWIPMHKSFPDFKREMEDILGQLISDMELELDHPEKLAALLDGRRIILVLDNFFPSVLFTQKRYFCQTCLLALENFFLQKCIVCKLR